MKKSYTLEKLNEMMERNGGYLDLRGTGITSLPEGLTVGGSLYLRGTGITSLPEGLTVGGSLDLENCTGITSLPEGLTVGGSLDLENCTGITSLPEGLTVGGYLDLRGTGITSLPEGLTVGGYLDLENCTGITSLPEGLTVGGSLNLENCTGITSLPEGLTVGDYLDLENCTGITSLPEGLTVGGYLDLRGTGITSLPEGLTVGGSLYLRGTGITSLPEGLTVGGSLYLRGTGIIDDSKYHRLREGDFVDGKYIYCDGILTHISKKRTFGQYTYFVGKIKGRDVIYDGEFYAHCKSFEDGVRDLAFNRAKNRGQEQYKDLTLDSVVKHDDAVTMYRIITGACQAGTNRFLEGLEEHKEEYTVREIIELTRGQFGSGTFEAFFKKEK